MNGGTRLTVVRALVAFLFAAALVSVRTVMGGVVVPGQPHLPIYGLQDFRDNYYYPAVAALDGRNPYDYEDYREHYPIDRPLPAYSPINFVVHLPLALLSFPLALAADVLMNLGLILVVAWLALKGVGEGDPEGRRVATLAAALAFAACLVVSRPGQMTVFLGQSSGLMAFGTTLALVEGKKRPGRAACGLALSCLKPSYGGPLGLLMLLRGDYQAFGLGSLLAAGALVLGTVGPMRAAGGLKPLLDSVRGSMAVVATDPAFNEATSLMRIDPLAVVGRLLGRPMGVVANLAVGLPILVAGGAAIAWLARRKGDEARPLSATLACLTILLVTYHQPYDGLCLALPLAAVAMLEGLTDRRRTVLLALLLTPCANFIATFALLNHLTLAPPLWFLVSSLNGLALTAALVMTLLEVVRLRSASRLPRTAPSP